MNTRDEPISSDIKVAEKDQKVIVYPPTPRSSTKNPAKPINRTLKWYSSWDKILSSDGEKIPEAEKERFYLDLFCLKVDKDDLSNKFKEIRTEDFIEKHFENLNDLIGYGIDCLKNSSRDSFKNQSFVDSKVDHQNEIDQAEGLDADDIDKIRLPNVIETFSIVFKHLLKKEGYHNYSLDLIKLIAGSIDRSDQVFSDLVAGIDHILSDETQDILIRHKTLQLTLSIVSAINQDSINAYFLRRDLFSTLASLISHPKTISMVFDSVLLLDILANFRRFESRNPYLVRMEDYIDENAMERIINLSLMALKDIRLAYMEFKPESNQSLIGKVTSVFNVFGNSHPTTPPRAASHAFSSQPARPVCVLLPLYDLLLSNAAFFNVLATSEYFWETFLSFSTYLLSHASANQRSELYGKLVLVIMTVLTEKGSSSICGIDGKKVAVNVCRQRLPPLGPKSDKPRAPIAALLDCTVLFLRHNLQKVLKIEFHVICLRLVHQLLFCLQSNSVRLTDFEWRELWRALLSLGSRVGGRAEELSGVQNADKLAQQILDILSFAAIWSEKIFIDRSTTSVLFFEILRSEHTIQKLKLVAGVMIESKGSTAGASTIESSKNLETIISTIKNMIEDKPDGESAQKQRPKINLKRAEDVLEIIERRLDEIELIDSASLENHLRKYTESEKSQDLKKFIDTVAEDVFELMVV
ncbi:hypothetical protein BY996DRAFT_4602016 [Phakopsora pachyrhizi]|nr:hypothetical protein BY996DRAFT_4602016 [Phakopsora pachyrhizi]